MRISPLMLAITLGLGLPANHVAEAAAATKASAASATAVRTYIVIFDERPLATFHGFASNEKGRPRLAATSPAETGARKLDVNSVESRAYRQYLADLRIGRLNDASVRLGRPLNPKFVYDVVNNGVAIELSAKEADILARMPGIKSVHLDFVRKPLTDRGPTWIKANTIWDGTASGIAKKGEGIVVGVIDTGVNASHDAFKVTGPVDGFTHTNARGRFYGRCGTTAQGGVNSGQCNNKLIGVADFTTGGAEADNGLDNTNSNASGHGTHTASTAVGNTLNITLTAGSVTSARQMSGVAPHANLITYKACEELASCEGSWLLAAINQAVADQVDVINYSIGGAPTDPWANIGGTINDDAEAFLGARAAGIVVSAAAGNDGPGPGTVGEPGNSPWVIGVAAATHDRATINRLINMVGGATAPPNGGILSGGGDISSPTSTGSLPIVVANDFPLCGQGTDPDTVPPTGVSKPISWTSTFWGGKIVVCQRGYYARVAKSNNVRLGGGGAMILTNQASDGVSTVPDDHSIPTTHLNYLDGQALLTWLSTGTGHSGRLEGTSITNLASAGDQLASFSSRGPVIPTGVIKPDLTAPGVSIVAASNTVNGCAAAPTTCYKYLSGTSMATPHVAGAAALLKSVKPTWTPSQIISALMLTARPSVTVSDGSIGTPHDQGSGMVDLSRAVNAGLYLNVTDAQFRAVNATNAHTLNLPSLANDNCGTSCVLTRKFTDLVGGGTWSISASLPAGATVTPSLASFSVANAATQQINFTFSISPSSNLVGKWVYGSVTLTDTSGNGRPSLTLPVALYSDPGTPPAAVNIANPSESGFIDVPVTGLAALPNARFAGTVLVRATTRNVSIAEDSTPADPFDSLTDGVTYTTFVLAQSATGDPLTYRIAADLNSPTASDVDLYIGKDSNGDGIPQDTEIVCTSLSSTATENCQFDATHPGTGGNQLYWALVQNYAGGSGSTDLINLNVTAVPLAESNKQLVITGPGHTVATDSFNLRLQWSEWSRVQNDTRFGYGIISNVPGNPIAYFPVSVKRTTLTSSPIALQPSVSKTIGVAPKSGQTKTFFDVLPNVTSVTFSIAGTGNSDLYIGYVANPTGPFIQAGPPTSSAVASATGPTSNESITLSGASLPPGRYYLTPYNTTNAVTSLNVKAVINTFTAAPALKPALYQNSARPGSYVELDAAGANRLLRWHTFLQDGNPVWYVASAPLPGSSGIWSTNLSRRTWNSFGYSDTVVGYVIVSAVSASSLRFTYNVDGESGSEVLTRTGAVGCPTFNAQSLDVSGQWDVPALTGFAYSVRVEPTKELYMPAVYDGLGTPRWLLASANYSTTNPMSIPLQQRKAYCALCAYVAATDTAVGSLQRTFAANNISSIYMTSTFVNGVTGSLTFNQPVSLLTTRRNCQ